MSSIGKPVLVVVLMAAPLMLALPAWNYFGDLGAPQTPLVYYTVKRADLPIVVTERGNLESQLETTIRCEVENSSFDRSGNIGTQIIFIVPNGSAVREGELLVEFDSAAIRDRLATQELSFDRAVSQRIQSQARYENQLTQNETLEAQAKLKVDLAKLNLEMYLDDDSGTFKLAMEDIERQIEEAKNQILEAQAALELEKTEKAGIQALFNLGYRGRSDLDQSRFRFLQAEDKLASAVNRLMNYQASRDRLNTYERQMQLLTLRGDVDTAQRGLKQVQLDNQANLEQAQAAKVEAEKAEKKEKERLDKLTEQLEKCKIFAPHDGMVVYARPNNRYSQTQEIDEGVTVRERQDILSLPDLSRMRVKTQIHEAVLDQVRYGLPVTVKIDALANRTYQGVVDSVAVVPSSSWYTSVKTYECVVRIDERVEQLKPGMTAVVEIHVDRLRDVLSVPVQAVVQIGGDTWCYVETAGGVERRDIQLGATNDKFVQVTEGLSEGARVALNPMAIVEETEKKENEITPDEGVEDMPEIPDLPAVDANGLTAPAGGKNQAGPADRGGPPRGKGESRRGKGKAGGPGGSGGTGAPRGPAPRGKTASSAE